VRCVGLSQQINSVPTFFDPLSFNKGWRFDGVGAVRIDGLDAEDFFDFVDDGLAEGRGLGGGFGFC